MRIDSPLLSRLARWGFVAALAVSVVEALTPDHLHVHPPWDKFGHFTCFYGLMCLAAAGFPRVRAGWLMLGLVCIGGGIELGQAIPFIHRDAEWGDLFADALGVLAATAPALSWRVQREVRALGG
jgi:hypothetical protein